MSKGRFPYRMRHIYRVFQDLSALVHQQVSIIDKQAAMIKEQSVRIQQLKDEKDYAIKVSKKSTLYFTFLNILIYLTVKWSLPHWDCFAPSRQALFP